ncbi:uncharacterized protein LOC143231296, partial [Tachypleus tridentatus]|uniref:uncharacterized protein LOC143231296 n=1 Tax=Tachypleus tridentatus TaxID=6853 RepID=UPI003FD249CC
HRQSSTKPKENREYISKIEPLVVGTAVDEGKFRVTDVVVRGLSSIGRRGDVTLTNDEANKKVVLNANLGVSGVSASGRYRYRQNRFIKLKGSLNARINEIAVQIILSAPLNGGQVTLVSAKVTRFEGFKITKVSGASFLFNWILKYAANKIAKKSKDKIVSGMESSLQRYLKDALVKVTFPGSV